MRYERKVKDNGWGRRKSLRFLPLLIGIQW